MGKLFRSFSVGLNLILNYHFVLKMKTQSTFALKYLLKNAVYISTHWNKNFNCSSSHLLVVFIKLARTYYFLYASFVT